MIRISDSYHFDMSPEYKKSYMRAKRITAALLLSLASAVLIWLLPGFYEPKLNKDPYRQWLMHEREPSVGVITVWYISGFRPYVGSVGSWLDKQAKIYASGFIGIHFDVHSYSPEDAASLISNGSIPDIISYTDTFIPKYELMPLYEGGGISAVPLCASTNVLLYDPSKFVEDHPSSVSDTEGNPESFKKGKSATLITDIRGAGDMARAQLMGKAPYFEVSTSIQEDFKVRFIGISSSIDECKLPYARGFIEMISSDKAQTSLAELGILPVKKGLSPRFDPYWLDTLYKRFTEGA